MDISEDSEPQQSQEQQQQQPTQQQVQWDVNTGSNSNEIDIDSSLLQQFSCLGTTDHEDLINDFQRLLANQINKDTARFFLEMSNWNLQTAACCYLDFCNFQNLPSMKIVDICRRSETGHVWKLQNNGDEDWPNGCYLMSPSQSKRIDVPSIGAGQTCDIVVSITRQGPPVMWRLCTPNGRYFGDTIWMNLPETDETSDLAERMSQLRTTPMSVDSSPSMNVVIFLTLD